MKYEVVQSHTHPSEYAAEFIDMDGEGECYRVLFMGPIAEKRANEYARLMEIGPGPTDIAMIEHRAAVWKTHEPDAVLTEAIQDIETLLRLLRERES